jgi:3-phosphoshikimate 1-carboxyvinyltransferase
VLRSSFGPLLRFASARRFRGRFQLPGDKSISHRLAILAALARGESSIDNFSTAADCDSTLACLASLGVGIERNANRVVIRGGGPEGLRETRAPLNAGNSGSTLRMLAGVLAGRPFRTILTGDASLRRRPVERVAAPLRAMGAAVTTHEGRPPLTVQGGTLQGIHWDLPVASAQVKTAVLLAGLQAGATTTVREPSASRDHTERWLPAFGVPVERSPLSASVRGGAVLSPLDATVPGDVSSAAFLVVAALVLPDSEAVIENVLLNPLRTAYLEVLRQMGASITMGVTRETPEPVGWIEARSSRLAGVVVPPDLVPALVDEIPALAIAAAHAKGNFTVSGAAELRVKESDRIAALCEGLAQLGADIEERPDGFLMTGGRPLSGAAVRSHGDHRIAMALSVAALTADGTTEIDDTDCVAVSFPQFYDRLHQATADPSGGSLPSRIVLVGFMGSGKSTVGAELARLLGWRLVDMDRRVEEHVGLSIPEIFGRHGEAAFREAEREVAREIAGLRHCVVAAGGGAFAFPETREVLRRDAMTVWLRCDFQTAAARIGRAAARPLAAHRETMAQLYAEREASYRLADWAVDSAHSSPGRVARLIRERIFGDGGTAER